MPQSVMAAANNVGAAPGGVPGGHPMGAGGQAPPGVHGNGIRGGPNANRGPPSAAASSSPDGGPKTKAMLKGWSSLADSAKQNRTNDRQLKASDTFNAFKKQAQEKQERERQLQEQLHAEKIKKAQEEKQRQQADAEKRRQQEEEDALEQARRAMMCNDVGRRPAGGGGGASTNHNSSGYANSMDSGLGGDGPPSNSSLADADAERARLEREAQRKKAQEARRREAMANQIDMNRQSDLMAAFEENII